MVEPLSPEAPRPQTDKLNANINDFNAIRQFLDWLSGEKKLAVCSTCESELYHFQPLCATEKSALVFEYFEIDPDVLDREFRGTLEYVRKRQKELMEAAFPGSTKEG